MSYASLLKQSVAIKGRTGIDRHGRETTGSSTTYNARFERRTRNIFQPDGSVIAIEGRVFLPNNAVVAVDDELVYDSVSYRVINVKDQQGAAARHHITVEVTKWHK